MDKKFEKLSEDEFIFNNNYYELHYMSELDDINPVNISLINIGSTIGIQSAGNLKNSRILFRDGVKIGIYVSHEPFLKNIIRSMSALVPLKYNIKLVEDIKKAHRETYPEEYI